MTKLDRLKEKLAEAEMDLKKQMYAGNLIGLQKYQAKIDIIKERIKEAELYSPQRLGNIASREDLLDNNIYEKLLEIILAADYLYDTAFDCKQALSKIGIEGFQIYDMVKSIEKISSDIASSVIIDDVGELEDFVVNDDEFVDITHTNAIEHIRKHLYLHPVKEKIEPLLRRRKKNK